MSALSLDLAAAVARAGVDPTLSEREPEDALRSAIADRRGYLGDWWVGADSLWHVELRPPDREAFGGRRLVWMLGAAGRSGRWPERTGKRPAVARSARGRATSVRGWVMDLLCLPGRLLAASMRAVGAVLNRTHYPGAGGGFGDEPPPPGPSRRRPSRAGKRPRKTHR